MFIAKEILVAFLLCSIASNAEISASDSVDECSEDGTSECQITMVQKKATQHLAAEEHRTVCVRTNGQGNVDANIPCTCYYNGNFHNNCCTGSGYGGAGWCGVASPPGEADNGYASNAWGGCGGNLASGIDKSTLACTPPAPTPAPPPVCVRTIAGQGNVDADVPCTCYYSGSYQTGAQCCQGTSYGGAGWCGVASPPGEADNGYGASDWGGCAANLESDMDFSTLSCPPPAPTPAPPPVCVRTRAGQGNVGADVPCTCYYNGNFHTDCCTGTSYGGAGWCGVASPPGEADNGYASNAWGGCVANLPSNIDFSNLYCAPPAPTPAPPPVCMRTRAGQGNVGADVPCTCYYSGSYQTTKCCQGTSYGGAGWCGVAAPPGATDYGYGASAWGGCDENLPGGYDASETPLECPPLECSSSAECPTDRPECVNPPGRCMDMSCGGSGLALDGNWEDEWSSATMLAGRYTMNYFKFFSNVKCMCMFNDWISSTGPLCADNYNYFQFWLKGGYGVAEQWEVFLYGNEDIKIMVDGVEKVPKGQLNISSHMGGAAFGPSPNLATNHTTFEICLRSPKGEHVDLNFADPWSDSVYTPGACVENPPEVEPDGESIDISSGGGLSVTQTSYLMVSDAMDECELFKAEEAGIVLNTFPWCTQDVVDTSGPFILKVSIKTSTTGKYQELFNMMVNAPSGKSGWKLGINMDGTLAFIMADGAGSGYTVAMHSAVVSDGVYHDIEAHYLGDVMKLVVDGNEGDVIRGTCTPSSTKNMAIGNDECTGTFREFSGEMKDIAIEIPDCPAPTPAPEASIYGDPHVMSFNAHEKLPQVS